MICWIIVLCFIIAVILHVLGIFKIPSFGTPQVNITFTPEQQQFLKKLQPSQLQQIQRTLQEQVNTQLIQLQPMTSQPMTTQPMTTQPMTTQPMTTQPMMTQPMMTQPMMTQPMMTQ